VHTDRHAHRHISVMAQSKWLLEVESIEVLFRTLRELMDEQNRESMMQESDRLVE